MVVKQGNNSIGQVVLRGGGEDYDKILVMDIERGRYFTADEIAIGRNVAVLGSEVAKTLFPNDEDPIGKTVKIKNLKYIVVGTVKKEGESMMGMGSNDYVTIIPHHAFRKLFQTGNGRLDETESFIAMKGYDSDIGLVELESEVPGLYSQQARRAPHGKRQLRDQSARSTCKHDQRRVRCVQRSRLDHRRVLPYWWAASA